MPETLQINYFVKLLNIPEMDACMPFSASRTPPTSWPISESGFALLAISVKLNRYNTPNTTIPTNKITLITLMVFITLNTTP